MVQKILEDDRKDARESGATTLSAANAAAGFALVERQDLLMLSALQLALERQAGTRANRCVCVCDRFLAHGQSSRSLALAALHP